MPARRRPVPRRSLLPSGRPLPTDRPEISSEANPKPAPRIRHDGLTPARQRSFFETLAATGSVTAAAQACGLSKQALYAHRNRDDCPAFRAAWGVALACAVNRLADAVIERAIEGVEEPVFCKGVQVGTRRRYNDRLALALLASRASDTPEHRTVLHGRVYRHHLRPPLEALLAALDVEAAGAAPPPAYDDDPGGMLDGEHTRMPGSW